MDADDASVLYVHKAAAAARVYGDGVVSHL